MVASEETETARRESAGWPMRPGSLVALVTPMRDDGSIDQDTLAALCRWHVECGTDGIIALGTTGESSTLSMEERADVLSVCRQELAGKVPLMVGTGTIDPKEVVRNNEQAIAFGADACLTVTPYYVKPTQQGMINHFSYIADATPLPMLLYNVPGRTAADLQVETVAVLSRHERIFGIKEATGDLKRVKALRELCGPDFMLLSGEDSNAFEFTLMGGDGVISVTSNVAPALQAAVFAAAMRGDAAAARALNAPMELLHQRLFLQANPIPVKWAVQRLGRCGGGIRMPLTQLEPPFHAPLEEAMVAAGVLKVATAHLTK